jgi:hypothetical protein
VSGRRGLPLGRRVYCHRVMLDASAKSA